MFINDLNYRCYVEVGIRTFNTFCDLSHHFFIYEKVYNYVVPFLVCYLVLQ